VIYPPACPSEAQSAKADGGMVFIQSVDKYIEKPLFLQMYFTAGKTDPLSQ
jgi:hypothetical protein